MYSDSMQNRLNELKSYMNETDLQNQHSEAERNAQQHVNITNNFPMLLKIYHEMLEKMR